MEAKGNLINKFKTYTHIILGSHFLSFQKQNRMELIKLWWFVEK